jgi:hypothetical protein
MEERPINSEYVLGKMDKGIPTDLTRNAEMAGKETQF